MAEVRLENGLKIISQQCKQNQACRKQQKDAEPNCRLNKFFFKFIFIKFFLYISDLIIDYLNVDYFIV